MQITVQELFERVRSGQVEYLVDVRTPAEYASERPDVPRLRNHPNEFIEQLDLPREAEIYLICRSGRRSAMAQQFLRERGYQNPINVMGGLLAWKDAGLPVTRTRGMFPIMRQVHLVAGLMALAGSLGALFQEPRMAWLAVLVGAGLTVSGTTGFCGMARLLGLMPWNRKAVDEARRESRQGEGGTT